MKLIENIEINITAPVYTENRKSLFLPHGIIFKFLDKKIYSDVYVACYNNKILYLKSDINNTHRYCKDNGFISFYEPDKKTYYWIYEDEKLLHGSYNGNKTCGLTDLSTKNNYSLMWGVDQPYLFLSKATAKYIQKIDIGSDITDYTEIPYVYETDNGMRLLSSSGNSALIIFTDAGSKLLYYSNGEFKIREFDIRYTMNNVKKYMKEKLDNLYNVEFDSYLNLELKDNNLILWIGATMKYFNGKPADKKFNVAYDLSDENVINCWCLNK